MRYAIAAGLLAVVFVAMIIALLRMNRRDWTKVTTPPAADPWDEGGAYEGWSPADEVARVDEELTPTELLPSTVARPEVRKPDPQALQQDTFHAIDARLNPALAPSWQRLDLMVKACEQATPTRPFQTVYQALWAEIPTGLYPIVAVAV